MTSEMERKGVEETVQNIQRVVDKLEKISLKPTLVANSNACSNIKLRVCDGKTSWQIYRKLFEAAAEASSWKSIPLVWSFREEALEVLQTLDVSGYKNYEDLILHLEMR